MCSITIITRDYLIIFYNIDIIVNLITAAAATIIIFFNNSVCVDDVIRSLYICCVVTVHFVTGRLPVPMHHKLHGMHSM